MSQLNNYSDDDYQHYKAPHRPFGDDICDGFSFEDFKFKKGERIKLNKALKKHEGISTSPIVRHKIREKIFLEKCLIGMDGDGI